MAGSMKGLIDLRVIGTASGGEVYLGRRLFIGKDDKFAKKYFSSKRSLLISDLFEEDGEKRGGILLKNCMWRAT